MEDQRSIRNAEQSDIPNIKEFLLKARFVHRHLDWRDPWDWVSHDVFLIKENKRQKIEALFCCSNDKNEMYWVRLFACKNPLNYFTEWERLFNTGLKKLQEIHPVQHIYSLAYFDWMIKLFELEGWNEIDRIIQFEWDPKYSKDYSDFDNHQSIRMMEHDDLCVVHGIDINGFAKIWQQSLNSITASFNQAKYPTVFVDHGKILGFQISTITNNHAHLARIAIHPDHRRKQIGESLVKDLINYCLKNNINDISVNTQQSNHSSTALYQKLNFRDTGKSFPIFSF